MMDCSSRINFLHSGQKAMDPRMEDRWLSDLAKGKHFHELNVFLFRTE